MTPSHLESFSMVHFIGESHWFFVSQNYFPGIQVRILVTYYSRQISAKATRRHVYRRK